MLRAALTGSEEREISATLKKRTAHLQCQRCSMPNKNTAAKIDATNLHSLPIQSVQCNVTPHSNSHRHTHLQSFHWQSPISSLAQQDFRWGLQMGNWWYKQILLPVGVSLVSPGFSTCKNIARLTFRIASTVCLPTQPRNTFC